VPHGWKAHTVWADEGPEDEIAFFWPECHECELEAVDEWSATASCSRGSAGLVASRCPYHADRADRAEPKPGPVW